MQKRYKIYCTEHKKNIWSVPQELIDQYGLTANQSITLKCGAKSIDVITRLLPEGNSTDPVLGLSPEALKQLCIPLETFMGVKQEKDGAFRLGPVIGILTFPAHVPARLGFYRSYAKLNSHNGILYVFRGRSINTQKRTITGYSYDYTKNTWSESEFPFPDAVIDRCYPNPYICHIWLENLIGRNRIFNKKTMIDKLQFVKVLSRDEVLKNHIPETWEYTVASQLMSMLQDHGEVFLKPVNGMKGHGIIVVNNTGRDVPEYSYMTGGKKYTGLLSSPKEISDVIKKAAGRKRPYIIQQGIRRMNFKGGPFSIRTWAMKNGKGQWVIPGMFAKGSFGEGFLTNFTAGAKLIPLKDFYESILPRLPYSKDRLLSLLKELTLGTAEALDREFGPLGELGLDIVFDQEGKPWLIEANGNPGIIPIFIQKEYPLWPMLLYKYPLDYATFLAGFSDN
ncbi:MAG: hypothetical protein CVU89_01660 [Firmicutes bacterium HGW-Firmicutes-14]|nr:MAG: hypothetical protein CVU89_01660 [Firmicutes bacterium HGW-Firmicutes-14]